MYWGQIAVGATGGLVASWLAVQHDLGLFAAAVIGILTYITTRWGIAWVKRVQYWHKRGTKGVYTTSCSNCGQYIYRLPGDWILTCRRCGETAGWPIIGWLTHSVPAVQLKRTVIGPKLVVVVLCIGLLALTVGAVDLSQDGAEDDDFMPSFNFSDVWNWTAGSDSEMNTTRVERLVFEGVNERRAERGMTALRYNTRAAKHARRHATDMAENDYFSHTSQDGVTQRERYSFCNGGENAHQTWVHRSVRTEDGTVRYTTEAELAGGIVTGWMNSKPHRERGIYGDRWIAAGVGVAISENDKVYAVMGFCAT